MREEAYGFCHGGLKEAAVRGMLQAVGREGLAEGEKGVEQSAMGRDCEFR